ncbi:MAG: trypsin-like peptidase domain-containing protein [Phycisphaerae bacterium]|nr:trypsin-like peptidase domain-containing protein [Phycisphaerae bacterium]
MTFSMAISLTLAMLAIEPDRSSRELVRAAEQARVTLIQTLAPKVVCVFPRGGRAGGGSGVLIDADGYGLTNYHVVAALGGGREGEGGRYLPQGVEPGRGGSVLMPLEVLGIDPAGDVAMFRLKGEGPFTFAPLGDSDALRVGDETLAMGNPFLLAEDFRPTVTLGIVSGLHRYLSGVRRTLIYTDCIQTDTSINPGNSGGPLFNMRGEIVGINGRIGAEERSRVNVGVGYAISSNQIRRFLPGLRAGLETQHATLGATAFDRQPRLVLIDQILRTSDAYRAGLRVGDRVLAFNGRPIHSANQLMNWVGSYPARWPVELSVQREDKTHALRFRLESLPLPRRERPPPDVPPEEARQLPQPLEGTNDRANIREVRRVLKRARAAVGPADVLDGLSGWTVTYQRTSARDGRETKAESRELRPADVALDANAIALQPAEIEALARWCVMFPPRRARSSQWRVTGGDEVAGRIAVVIERRGDEGLTIEMAFDDETARLLYVSFTDPVTGKLLRFEYGDFRTVGGLSLPHLRTMYVEHDRFAEDRVQEYRIADGAAQPSL